MTFPSLLVDVQRRLEAFYALPAEPPVTDFLIGDDEARDLPGGGSRTLVSQEGDEVSLAVVLDRSVSENLAQADPRERLDGENLGAFTTLTEEVSHFLYLMYCARAARPATQLELELQGEVDKYLTVAFFLSLQNEGAFSARLRHLLFRSYRLAEGLSPERAERYRVATQPRRPLLRLAGGALPARLPSARPRARNAPVLPPRTAREAREDRGDPLIVDAEEHARAVAAELKAARRLRMVVDLTTAVLVQGRLSRAEAEELVAAARTHALELFPGKESTYELCSPRASLASWTSSWKGRPPRPTCSSSAPAERRERPAQALTRHVVAQHVLRVEEEEVDHVRGEVHAGPGIAPGLLEDRRAPVPAALRYRAAQLRLRGRRGHETAPLVLEPARHPVDGGLLLHEPVQPRVVDGPAPDLEGPGARARRPAKGPRPRSGRCRRSRRHGWASAHCSVPISFATTPSGRRGTG